ncbi:MAG: SpoIID/LytB domain-containing protein [Firmicutes bacterium]|jgi:stage II sporulation protein D|nr:SpoIID/LytB domain-containing protein [Bacillota bacterium]
MKAIRAWVAWSALVVLAGALMVVAPGCSRLFRRPAPSPGAAGQEPTLNLYSHRDGTTRQVKIEDYVQGVVAAETLTDWPLEALKAQAVVARTFTLQKRDEGNVKKLHGTDACDDKDHFQAYDPGRINEAVRRAVQETRGLVIEYGGKPIRAWFHSNSGGKTATAQEGLNFTQEPAPYTAAVDDPYSLQNAPSDQKSWTATFTAQEIQSAASRLGKSIPNVRTASIGKKGPSGRALTLKFGDQELPAAELRTALGPEKMKSTLLDSVTVSGGRVLMKGRGWGHGVGMSQWGAEAMAKAGKKAEDIIAFYYKGVQIRKMWQ